MSKRPNDFFWGQLATMAVWTLAAVCAQAQAPIAIIPLENRHPGQGPTVTGALEVAGERAMIAASGTVTAGTHTAQVLLPHRGELHVCASTTVRLAADTSVPAEGSAPGLLLAFDRGALELSLANRGAAEKNADVLLTPDFRILIGGVGAGEIKVRLGEKGDTCVENTGTYAPYVLVSSLFGDGAYRVQPGQRVMFQHGSLHEVVDAEKEPCGCPPETSGENEFPLAQSEGLQPLPASAPSNHPVLQMPLVHNGSETAVPSTEVAKTAPSPDRTKQGKAGFFGRVGQFFRHIFGAE